MLTPSDFLPWLVWLSFQAGILVLLILAVKVLLGRFLTPWWHFALWFLVLARLVIPVGPESDLSLSNYISPTQWIGQSSNGPKSFQGFLQTPAAPDPASSVVTPTDPIPDSFAASPKAIALPLNAAMTLTLAWLTGTLTMLLILARNTRRLWTTLRLARPVDDPAIRALFDACCVQAGITRRVALLTSDEIATPALAGLFRPVVLLPARDLSTTSAAELKFIILHELIHLRRGDLIVGCAAALLQAIHWCNPLIWIGFYRMRADREVACDAEVVELLGRQNAADYGRTILKLAEHASAPRFFAGSIGIIEVKSETGRRIIMISQHRKHSRVRALCGFAIAAIIAAVSFTEAQSQRPETISVPASHGSAHTEQHSEHDPYAGPEAGMTTATVNSQLNPVNSRPPIIMEGIQPFTLSVEENIGELIYKFNENTKELESIEAQNGVVFSTEKTTISCNNLVYNSSTQELIATGPGLEVQLPAKKAPPMVTAEKLVYDTSDGTMIFSGGVAVVQKDSDGLITETRAENATLTFVNGKYRIKMKTSTDKGTYKVDVHSTSPETHSQ